MKSLTNSRILQAVAPRARVARAIVAVAIAGMSMAACDVHGTSAPGTLSTLTISPDPQTLVASGTQQFTVVATDFSGAVVTSTPVWSIVAGGGTISASGMFTAGTTPQTYTKTVQAVSDGITATATVIVTAGSLATITVTPNPATLPINTAQQFTAVGKDVSGNVVPITPSWSVVAGGGSISPTTGLFTAGSTTGTYASTVRASVGGVAGVATVNVTNGPLATITVTPNPASVQTNATQSFSAVGKDAGGNVVAITPAWSVVNGGGSIDAGTGLFTAGTTTGTFANTVRAGSGTISGTATVTVTPVLATITVTPNPASVPTNSSQQFAATGRDASGTVIPISPVWSVVNGGGSIDPNTGLFTAGAVAGTFTNTVQATSGTISGTATVTVSSTAPNPIVNLGTAAPNGIMAGTAFTCVTGGTINANIAISPGSTVTGFPPCVITGVQHLADGVAAQAQLDLTNAYNTLAGLPCAPANNIGTTNIGGTTKAAGVYCSASSIGVTGTLILDGGGDPNAYFVFQAGTGLTTAGNVVLINGAQAKNVYWQVGSSATIGTASQWKGNIVALTSITLVDNANLLGRALARNGAVSLGTNNTITLP
jgi:Ice-binding-like